MTLDVLVFVLGFCAAGLLALACLPAVWARALRLTEERLSRLVPLSAEEIAAERDHLRAAHAVEIRRAEQKLEGSEVDRAALRAEAGRREGRIAALGDDAVRAQVRVAALEAEAAGLQRDVDGLWAEHGAEAIALDGLSALAERRLGEVAALQGELRAARDEAGALREERDGLRHALDGSRGSVAGLETRLIGAETRGGDLQRELDEARRAATAAAERLAAAAAEREAAAGAEREAAARPAGPDGGAEVEALRAELAFMAEQARSAERRAAESLKDYEALKAERAEGGAPAASRGDDALRAAVAALADEVMRAAGTARG